jgi:hypothetical protein
LWLGFRWAAEVAAGCTRHDKIFPWVIQINLKFNLSLDVVFSQFDDLKGIFYTPQDDKTDVDIRPFFLYPKNPFIFLVNTYE